MIIDRTLKKSFNSIGKKYDDAREDYPEILIEDIINISNIKKTSKILDIGCGSGKTTILFGKRGYDILGLDISEELIFIAKRNSSNYKNIHFIISSFEDAKLVEHFDLIIAAQSWHWLDPAIAYKKAYDLLKTGGHLALFWKYHNDQKMVILKRVKKIFQKHCPKYHHPIAVVSEEEELHNTKLFEPFIKKQYEIELEFDKKRFLALSSTYSWVIDLSEEKRELMLNEIALLLDELPYTFKVPYIYTLLITQKREEKQTHKK